MEYNYVKPKNGKPGVVGYQVDSVKVDLVLDASGAQGGAGRSEQTFSLKFVAKGPAQNEEDGEIVYRSGNPGYATGKPLIVGENPGFTVADL